MKTKLLPLLFLPIAANAADLVTTLSSSHSKIMRNNTITYTGSVINKGYDTASNVRLVFFMPPQSASVNNLPSNCYGDNSKITCNLGDLNAGDSDSVSLFVNYNRIIGGFAGVNALSDTVDSNYADNFSRLVTNVNSNSSIAASPLIPTIFNVKAEPTSIIQGNSITFSANLNAPLPAGYSVKAIYDGSQFPLNGSKTRYNLTQTPSVGLRTFRIGIYDNYGNLQGSEMTGTFEVTKANFAPTLSFISGTDSIMTGSNYSLQLQANDVDNNLSSIQITNWGDGANESQTASNGANVNFSHTFNSAGSYTISATAYDSANATSSPVSKTVNVNAAPVKADTNPTGTSGYTKISNSGYALPDSAQLGTNPTDWACTKDNNTGRIWEVKTDDDGLRDKDWWYSWYEPDASKNDGSAGVIDTIYATPGCSTRSNCNTYSFTNAVNAQGLCGASDWRMPTIDELKGIVKPSASRLLIDTSYFPNTESRQFFWSSSPHDSYTGSAWVISFVSGSSSDNSKSMNVNYVRLIR
jgi:hypothetical protein